MYLGRPGPNKIHPDRGQFLVFCLILFLPGVKAQDNQLLKELFERPSTTNDSSDGYLDNDGVFPSTKFQHFNTTTTTNTTSAKTMTTRATTTAEGCVPPVVRLVDLQGSIKWTGYSLPCATVAYWQIHVPEDYAVTVKIIRMFIAYGDYKVEFHSLASWGTTADVSPHNRVRIYEKNSGDLMYFPLLCYSNNLVIVATPPTTYNYAMVSFEVSYSTHPLVDMPTAESIGPLVTDSVRKYTCLYNVPEVLLCDMIAQCADGTDERNCSYKEDGSCGSWIPYADHCIQPFFISYMSYVTGQSLMSHPLQAEEECLKHYGGYLAKLTDKAGVELVGRMIRAAGFGEAVIGLKKVKPVSSKLRHFYRYLWQWGDRGSPIAYDQPQVQRVGPLLDCAMLTVYPDVKVIPLPCVLPSVVPRGYVCMRANPTRPQPKQKRLDRLDFPPQNTTIDKFHIKKCADGSLVQTFHKCIGHNFKTENETSKSGYKYTMIFSDESETSLSKSEWSESNLPLFQCQFGRSVHYTLVCDGNEDCPDKSDELFCQKPRFPPLREASFSCGSSQIIPISRRCDGQLDCFDGTDEENCATCRGNNVICSGLGCMPNTYAINFPNNCPSLPPIFFWLPTDLPAVLKLDGKGMSTLDPDRECSDLEFKCSNGLCIPAFLINNGEQDCLLGEDEAVAPDNVTCPGFYRCQEYGLCVHKDYLCDGLHHCPNKDDERYCDLVCPENCTCEGYAYTCGVMFTVTDHLQVRYLDLSGAVTPSLNKISYLEFLMFLNLSFCHLSNLSLVDMPLLRILDLSYNLFTGIDILILEKLSGLRFLNLSGNPLVSTFDSTFTAFLTTAELNVLEVFTIRNTDLVLIKDCAFEPLQRLKMLDIRENKLEHFDKKVFGGLNTLQTLYSDNHKLCCPYFNPPVSECYAPKDELSSCSDLLRLDVFRVFLWCFSVFAIFGNSCSLVYRLCSRSQQATGQQTSRVLVANLCAADFVMGMYMMIIGSADMYYRGVYVSSEREWRHSGLCKMAGFLGFLSCEVSAFVICLITLDRFFMICFPLKSNLHMKSRSAVVACCTAWVTGLALASVPLMTQWEFYGQSGICLPLPITRQEYQGQEYAFAVFIVLNFVLFLLIGAGQVAIFQSVRAAGSKFGNDRRQQDMTVARRLFLIVLTDFLCWFPIGLMGLLANQGTPIPGDVNVWAAIFVVPLNAALNPFLYTINGLTERWDRRREAARIKTMIGKLHSEIPKWTPATVEELTRICVRSKLVNKERVLQLLGVDGAGAQNVEKSESFPVISDAGRSSVSDFESSTRITDAETS